MAVTIQSDPLQSKGNILVDGIPSFSFSSTGLSATNVTGSVSNTSVLATGTLSARSLQNRFADVINVKDFGAKGDFSQNDGPAIQAAIDFVEARVGTNNYNGGLIYFPPGGYRVDNTLTINNSFVVLEGAGVQSTYLAFTSLTQDGIVIDGATALGGNLRDVCIYNMSLNSSTLAKTSGAHIKIKNAYRCTFQNIGIEYCVTGLDVGENTNGTTVRDATIIPNLSSSLHGIWWHCPVDGSTRSDVLTLNNVVISGQWSDATCVLWEGFCATMVTCHLRVLHARYGLRIKQPTGQSSGSYYPQFLNAHDIQAEGFKKRAISIEAGGSYKISASDFNNLTGYALSGVPVQLSADDYAFAIEYDNSSPSTYTRNIQVNSTRIGLCQNSGIYCNGWDVQFTNCNVVTTSMSGTNLFPAILIDSNARNVQLANMRCEEFGGAGKASFGVQVNSGARGVQLANIDATYCQRRALNILTNFGVGAVNIVEPADFVASGLTYDRTEDGNNYTFYNETTGNFWLKTYNNSAQPNANARFDWATGVPNAFAIAALKNNSGTPIFQLANGSAVQSTFIDINQNLRVRTAGGSNLVSVLSSGQIQFNNLPTSATGLPAGSVWRDTSTAPHTLRIV